MRHPASCATRKRKSYARASYGVSLVGHKMDTGVRSQDTGVRRQESGVRSQETGDRTQDTEHRSQNKNKFDFSP